MIKSVHQPLLYTCPDHFCWIYEDLRPWKETRITREKVEERAWVESNFRLVTTEGLTLRDTGRVQSGLALKGFPSWKTQDFFNTSEAQEIGKASSDFIQVDLKMDYVYDYMFHLLSEYAKLMRHKPTIPKTAIEICSEKLACPAIGSQEKFIMESMVKGPTDVRPCNMPPPYDALALHTLLERKTHSISQAEFGSIPTITCIEQEGQALLKFKRSLTDTTRRLSSWTGEDCCNWKGIQCDGNTSHVVKLDLVSLDPDAAPIEARPMK
ncbi:hypothetical protein RHSIM_Rhsim03G0181900 [Rhododendron simsii]|uniref:Leucine-rich repeat-containing N-terminal plant-type domain-containing protein n=1 Tax=Rhododendron simsii TaxID=118357 RepID=A0A834HGX8_RHOSS|nr:hypothetical protein RHSIM_Rhsim03G0181900 [Rhododendron simsii]